jgi:phosphate transport system substrate-binding protein
LCATQIGGLEIVLEERFPEFFDADLRIQIGEPQQAAAFAAQIAQEELTVIVNPQNPISSLTTDEIQRLFSGQIVNWSQLDGDDAPVAVWVPLDGDNTRSLFEEMVLDGFQIASSANLAPDPAAMQQAVGGNPYAIGYITHANLTSSDDLHPILLGVRLPVLVLAESTPQDAVSQLAACLQSGPGQEMLAEIYP